MNPEMVCASEGVTPTTQTTHHFKTMSVYGYQHKLSQVKFAHVLGQMFGETNPIYEADEARTNHTWHQNNLTNNVSTDYLLIDGEEVPGQRLYFSMQSGILTETKNGESTRMDAKGFENVIGRSSQAKLSIYGTNEDNRILGGQNDDIIAGNGGNDNLSGNGGADRLLGGDGNDHLYGESGNDFLSGGKGYDQVRGGSGSDVFSLSVGHGYDWIGDFEDGVDQIKLDENQAFNNVRIVDGDRGNAFIYNGNDLCAMVQDTAAADLTLIAGGWIV